MEDKIHLKDFEKFMQERLKSSTDFLNGQFESLKDISVQDSPATIFPPNGIYIQGANEVNQFNENGAGMFKGCEKNTFEVFHQNASETLAYWTGIQRSVARIPGKDEPVTFNLRITEIFTKENGQWKLMHRHADNLKED